MSEANTSVTGQLEAFTTKCKHAISSVETPESGVYRLISGVVALLAASLVIVLMHQKIYALLTEDRSFEVQMEQLQALHLPDWVNDRVRTSIRDRIRGEPINLLERTSLKQMKKRYEQSPWVRKVRKIRRQGVDGVQVSAELRRPAAAVQGPDQAWYLVDKNGIRLPGTYKRPAAAFDDVYQVAGVTEPPPKPGTQWDGKRVLAAAHVARKLQKRDMHEKLAIERLQVNGDSDDWKHGKGQIVLWSRKKVPVIWGGVKELSSPWEPDSEEKLKHLRLVLSGAPELKGLKSVKLQYHDPIVTMNED